MEVEKYLIGKGILVSFKGFDYFVKAIELVQKDRMTYKRNFTKKLYPEISRYFKVSSSSIQRAMYYCLKKAKIHMTIAEFISFAEYETRK